MGLKISVTVTGVEENISKLKKLGQTMVLFDRAWNDIGTAVTAYVAGQVFASRGGVLDEGWPELDSEYALRKAKKYPGRSPLVLTGAMQKGFRHETDSHGVTIFNTQEYFAYHQSDEPRSRLPRRVMLKANDPIRNIVAQIIDKDIKTKIQKAGL